MGKNNPDTENSTQAENESMEENTTAMESAQAGSEIEQKSLDAHPDETDLNDELRSAEDAPASNDAEDTELSPDDLLEDVRRSLIEEESEQNKKDDKWWRRIGRRSKNTEPEQPAVEMEIDLPTLLDSTDVADQQTQTSEPEEQVDEIEDLIDLLAAETEEKPLETMQPAVAEIALEPQPEIDLEKLKEQAFRPETPEEAENVTDVRTIALEGGEEVFVEVQPQTADALDERVKGFENALRPYRRYIYSALAILGVAMAVVASLIIYNAYKFSTPQPVQEVSNLPFPTSVSLPGGWAFQLGKGTLQDGKWEPRGAEWLQGTEVCRWVALPWSRQLEAVIRTLNPKDPIELVMSNNDKLTYGVYSIQQLSPEEMQKLDSNSPCLLLILTQPDSEKRWVLTALP